MSAADQQKIGESPALDATTVLTLRQVDAQLEVFCIQRSHRSGFLAGATAFPGGKLDASDADVRVESIVRGADPRVSLLLGTHHARTILYAAFRELVEEAAILPARQPVSAQQAIAVRQRLQRGEHLVDVLLEQGIELDGSALWPFARWVTPKVEPRRFDARFFLSVLPSGQQGDADEHETTRACWARPAELLDRFHRGEIQCAPPTTRCLELLSQVSDLAAARSLASQQSLRPICPLYVLESPPFLALPGDPAHEEATVAVAGPTRFVLEDGRFVSKNPSTQRPKP